MDGSDLYVERNGEFVGMTETLYATEDELQGLLERNAALLGGNLMNPASPVRFVLVRRESGIPSSADSGAQWSIDHVFLDQDAIPTLVEVKRSTDTRIRREVVGQMLDYAANAVAYWPASRLRTDFEATCTRKGLDPTVTLVGLLRLEGDHASPDAAEATIEQYWQQVSANLAAGRLRLLFVADTIPATLRRIIEFLNERMTPTEVLGVEVRNYQGEDLRVVVPTVIGRTESAEQNKRVRSSNASSSASVTELLGQASPEIQHAEQLLGQWAVQRSLRVWDDGKSRRYALGEDAAIIKLYPHAPYEMIELDVTRLPAEQASVVREALTAATGKTASGAFPSIKCVNLAADWDRLVAEVLTPFVNAYQSGPT